MATPDTFRDIARYYDPIMSHVNYERWYFIATALARLLPPEFVHLDAACGTGNLTKRLRKIGWNSMGVDLSEAMLRAGQKGAVHPVTAVADLRALPFRGGVHYVTCLFDSLNFILTVEEMRAAIHEFGAALKDGGVLYFDTVTERMITQHFHGQRWTEKNGRFSTTWSSHYDRATSTAETHIQVDRGPGCIVRERVFSTQELMAALADAGFTLLGQFDAETWRPPGRRTTRVEYVATKGATPHASRRFLEAKREIQGWLPA
ncbi:MAG: class I SAM-dependent methyltransferase [Candidatus Hydrogenedentes bacterium]|nr:class I SAM-dependent methyltransferase [Candidatus Hydrogenedentota bacterium]